MAKCASLEERYAKSKNLISNTKIRQKKTIPVQFIYRISFFAIIITLFV
jgi:hypothetical protein